jgi:hypothetical protein
VAKVGLKDRLKRLEKEAEGEMMVVPLRDGTVARFPQSACAEALVSLLDGRDHSLARAARDSSDPEWTNSFYCTFPLEEVEDLSEP